MSDFRVSSVRVLTLALILSLVGSSACASGGATASDAAPSGPAPAPAPDSAVMAQAARADSLRQSYNEADVAFMTGMIHHHAQALVMSRMAPTHGAGETMLTLTARIMNGQRSEIALMQQWLRDRGEPVPQPDTVGADLSSGMAGHDGHGDMNMAGMLSPEQLAELDAARGEEWERLFLTYMIQHHQGAITMVDELFASYGGGQGDAIFKIASDISADQASEIDRMQRMLHAMIFGPGDASSTPSTGSPR